MLETGIAWPGTTDGEAAPGDERTAGGAALGWAGDHDSMSRLITRPPGPLPGTAASGILRSAAMLRASGLALTRPSGPAAGGVVGAPTGVGCGSGVSGSACAAGGGGGAAGIAEGWADGAGCAGGGAVGGAAGAGADACAVA